MQQHPAMDRSTVQLGSSPHAGGPSAWPLDRLLSAAARRVEHDWTEHLSAWRLTPAGLPVLVMLLDGPRTQAELAAGCQVTEQAMSRTLARLEDTGHLRRAQHPLDRRKRRVELSDTGRQAAAQATDQRSADQVAARGLAADQVAMLRSLLTLVADPPR